MKRAIVLVLAVMASPAALGQVKPYGVPTPAAFTGTFDTGGQIPVLGNSFFKFVLHDPNANGGGIVIGSAPTSTPFGSATLLVDLAGATIINLAPGTTESPIALPNVPALAGFTAFAQAGVFDGSLPGGLGLTNAVKVTLLPDRTPTRAYLPGQDFSVGANAPGQMSVLDVSVQPPAFRATGNVGFAGNISDNFPNKIAVADRAKIAYALGNSATNQFVRAFNVAADPAGIVTHVQLGDIPTAGTVSTIVGQHDMEVTSNGRFLFVVSAGSNVTLEVFDTGGMPAVVPTAAIQTITFGGASSGAVGLELSPADDRLAVVISSDTSPAITLYDITPAGPQLLTLFATVPLASAFPGFATPSDVHFTPDGHQLFVTGTSGATGTFSVVDVQTSTPAVLIPAQTWSPLQGNLWCHGSAVALMNGAPVGVVAGDGLGASFTVFDLNPVSATFGTALTSFSTNPGANISNHRMHGRGSIVVAIDGTGALSDCEWVDVIDLSQAGPAFWRVKMPHHALLAPGGSSSIPRDFDLY